ncbi:aminotransferase class I/II-fold pyridoxal phosphate-dependent enzyme [Nostocoides sp. Soil756]|uniref:pyridoxal phosphate-dependent aminotransferase n=1 Tax=Nostocoides sp. Soil756 TaxID=1736399 RepID=UPI0006F664E9|nr:aminotransferase class I/II-fold pyridoxal phosphate-dependent enzyme [Tetrasphaera sp. Soil756]KRE60788.1 aspartate aminotransferase [Tetrasphaera sp. Soil756]
MTEQFDGPESERLRRTHLPERRALLGMSVREADLSLGLDGAGGGLLDTTHFDTVRFPPPEWALESFAGAYADGNNAYTAYRGSSEVRRACAQSISSLMGIDIDPSRHIAVTAGTQSGLFAVLSALVDEGDVVVLADPEYLFVERMLRFLGAEVVRLPFVETEAGLQPDLDQLEALSRRGVSLYVTSNPNNPTGAVFTEETVVRLARIASEGDFTVLVDELYCRLVYDDTPYTHLAAQPGMTDRTVTLLGGSKTESLSGFRVGVVVGPGPVIDAIEQVLAMMCLRAPAYAQHVLTRWLVDDHDFVARRLVELQSIQRSTVAQLRTVPGLRVSPGAGTAYLWPDVSALRLADVEVARLLQDEAGVVVSPGYQFGPSGIGRFRICYAREEVEWARAVDRMTSALTRASRLP